MAYVANCTAQTHRSIAYAGYAIADVFAQVRVPSFARATKEVSEGARGSEVAAWVVMGGLAPLAAVLVWKLTRK
jgi:hypothetical protein